jgi:hypothetical protein
MPHLEQVNNRAMRGANGPAAHHLVDAVGAIWASIEYGTLRLTQQNDFPANTAFS